MWANQKKKWWSLVSPDLPAKLQPDFSQVHRPLSCNLPFKGQGPQGPRRSRQNTCIGAYMFFPGLKHDIVKQPGRCLPSKIHLGSSVHTLWLQNSVQTNRTFIWICIPKSIRKPYSNSKGYTPDITGHVSWLTFYPPSLTMRFLRKHYKA